MMVLSDGWIVVGDDGEWSVILIAGGVTRSWWLVDGGWPY